ncbi:glutamate cyclase domain-containing protein [Roseobacter weihaiensis]|uniref:glutamate cyclase domain-containing protein n=1 Tax=Roseobacter weihaiensis TaxID=2763262 RepID=UPI001D0B3DED|nr:glutamate cyclase domain-containing protein [Roseobacter sp. H9]
MPNLSVGGEASVGVEQTTFPIAPASVQDQSAESLVDSLPSSSHAGYKTPETLQIFSSDDFRGREFVLYQVRNSQTGEWEARILSAHPDKLVADILVYSSKDKLTRADFGKQQPAWQGLLDAEEKLNAPQNVADIVQGNDGNLAGNTAGGALLGNVFGLIKTVAMIPEGIGRPALWLVKNPLRITEKLQDILLPGDQTTTGTDNPLNYEAGRRFADGNWLGGKVQQLEDQIGDLLNVDTHSIEYQIGAFIGGVALAKLNGGRGGNRNEGSSPKLPGKIDADSFAQSVRNAPVDEVIAGLARVPDEALQTGLVEMPAVSRALKTRLRPLAGRSPAAAQALNRLNSLSQPTGAPNAPPRDISQRAAPQTVDMTPPKPNDITTPQQNAPGPLTAPWTPSMTVSPKGPATNYEELLDPTAYVNGAVGSNSPANQVPGFEQTFSYMTQNLTTSQKQTLRPILEARVEGLDPEAAYRELVGLLNTPDAIFALYDEAAIVSGQAYADAALTVNGKAPTVFPASQEAEVISRAYQVNAEASLEDPGDTFAVPLRLSTDFGPAVTLVTGTASEIDATLNSPALSGDTPKTVYDPELSRSAGRTKEGIASALDRPPVVNNQTEEGENVETLENISQASLEELDAWYAGLSEAQIAALPEDIQRTVAGVVASHMRQHLQTVMSSSPQSSLISPSELAKLNRETLVNYASTLENAEGLREAVTQGELDVISDQLSNEGYYVMALFDSGNGGIAASKVFANMIHSMDGADVRLLVLGDHQMQPYGSKNPGQIAMVVKNGMLAAQQASPDVTPFACNTACTAIERMERENPDLISGLAVEDLITNTAWVVSNPKNEPFFGTRPMILSTQATKDSGMYSNLIAEFSGGRVQPYDLGASDPPVNVNGQVWTRDLATLVNELAHLDHTRVEEVQSAVDHYVAQMQEDITSIVLCCTHYPELTNQIRTALDNDPRGMKDVQIINPMTDQVLTSLNRLILEDKQPRMDDPERRGGSAVVSSALNKLTPQQRTDAEAEFYGSDIEHESVDEFIEEQAEKKRRGFDDVFESVPALTGRSWPTFTGQVFDQDFYMDRISDYIAGRISAVDVATMGFNGRSLHTFFNTNGASEANPTGIPARNGATNAAEAMQNASTVLIGTGFNVPPPGDFAEGAQPSTGRPETDGPLGAAAQARVLANLGKEVHLVGDQANMEVVRAALAALGVDVDPDTSNITFHVFEAKGADADTAARELLGSVQPDVVQMIEVPGRNEDAARTNMGNVNIDGINPDLDAILLAAQDRQSKHLWGKSITTIGVGDGGNEAGMGDLDLSRITIRKPSVVPADIVVTSENSNLGGYAIAAELVRLEGMLDETGMLLTRDEREAMLDAAIDTGAVDGVGRFNKEGDPMVDGFGNRYHGRILDNLNRAVKGDFPDR